MFWDLKMQTAKQHNLHFTKSDLVFGSGGGELFTIISFPRGGNIMLGQSELHAPTHILVILLFVFFHGL